MSRDESGRRDPSPLRLRSRRQYLSGVTALGAVALAGCTSGGDGNGGTSASSDGNGDVEPSGDGCPSLPLSYTETHIDGSPALTFGAPVDAAYTLLSEGTDGVGAGEVSYPPGNGGEPWYIQIAGVTQDGETTVNEAVETYTFANSTVEVTADYDPADDRTRVFLNEIRSTWELFLPGRSTVVQVGVNPTLGPSNVACTDAAMATVTRIVETLRAAE